MGITEIVLLVVGALFFIISFFVGDNDKKPTQPMDENKIKEMIDREMDNAKGRIDDMVDETVNYSIEKTERALERLSNEKIMAVDQYSETVLKKINDNHQEAVFLYDMLNEKSEKLKKVTVEDKETVKDTSADTLVETKKPQEPTENEASITVKEPKKSEEQAPKEQVSTFTPFVPERIQRTPSNESAVVKSEKVKSTTSAKTTTKTIKNQKVNVHFDKGSEGSINNNEQIRRMHEEGKSNMAIAKELGLGLGEVKLVIDLFANKK